MEYALWANIFKNFDILCQPDRRGACVGYGHCDAATIPPAIRHPLLNAPRPAFFTRLIKKTENFGHQTWLGQPIWQNIFDLWTIQETVCELRPDLLIECGTHRGGSSYFFATLFDLIGHGRVITIDIAKMHDLSLAQLRSRCNPNYAVLPNGAGLAAQERRPKERGTLHPKVGARAIPTSTLARPLEAKALREVSPIDF